MKRALIIIMCLILTVALTYPTTALALDVNALTPHVEVLTPGVNRNLTITQYADFPQDFSPFIVFLIGYGPFKISLSKDESVGDRLKMNGVGISPAGIVPFYKSGKADVDLVVSVEIGNERSPYGMVLFSSWVSGTVIQEPDSEGVYHNTYKVTLQF
jgi:hypothetical protein